MATIIELALTIIKKAEHDIGDLQGAECDLLLDNMDISSVEAIDILRTLGYKCGFCKQSKQPGEECKGEHYISASTEGY